MNLWHSIVTLFWNRIVGLYGFSSVFFDDFLVLIYFHFLVNSNNGYTNKADSAFIIAPKLGKYFA